MQIKVTIALFSLRDLTYLFVLLVFGAAHFAGASLYPLLKLHIEVFQAFDRVPTPCHFSDDPDSAARAWIDRIDGSHLKATLA